MAANGPGYVRTGAFKKKVAREERLAERGELQRGPGGDLPVEMEERRNRKLLCMEDMRLALSLGDSYLGQTPLISGGIMDSRFLDTEGIEHIYDRAEPLKPLTNGVLTNGVNGTAHAPKHAANAGESWNVDFGDPMQLDDDLGAQWQGGSVQDITDMDAALDDLLGL